MLHPGQSLAGFISIRVETLNRLTAYDRSVIAEPDIASAAALFGDPARAAMLSALLDRAPLSAGQLAFAANVSPQSASFHLSKLTSAAILIAERNGRNHVYRLAGPEVASAIESLAAISRPQKDRWGSERMGQLRAARTCYDHLAGIAGVELHDALLRLGYLVSKDEREYALTKKGRAALNVNETTRSVFARRCLDWSERRPHLAGRLAAQLLERFFEDGWIARIRGTRAVRITERGLREFERQYGIAPSPGRL